MEMKRLTDFSQIETIFNTRMRYDFTENELRPLLSLRRSWDRDEYAGYALMEGGEMLAYALFVRNGENYLFDYYAVSKEHRGEGLGSIFLKRLADCFPDAGCIVGEVEDPDKALTADEREIRERRLRFYLRNGYRETGVKARVRGADFRILEVPTGKMHSDAQILHAYKELYRSFFPKLWFYTRFRVW